jgi:hypothetical protein
MLSLSLGNAEHFKMYIFPQEFPKLPFVKMFQIHKVISLCQIERTRLVPCTRPPRKNAFGRFARPAQKVLKMNLWKLRYVLTGVGSFSMYTLVLHSLVSVGSSPQTLFLEWAVPLDCVQLFSHHQFWYFKAIIVQ